MQEDESRDYSKFYKDITIYNCRIQVWPCMQGFMKELVLRIYFQ